MAKKKKKKKAPVETVRLPKPKVDLPTQELALIATVPEMFALELWDMRHDWNRADPGWTWTRPGSLKVVLARIKATTRSRVPALGEIAQKIFAATPEFTFESPIVTRDPDGQKLELFLEPLPVWRDLQLRLGQAIILGGFALEEKGLPAPRALLARRKEDSEPSQIRPTQEMTIPPFDSWVVAKAHLVEARQGHDDQYTSLSAWKLAKIRAKSDWW